MFLFIYSVIISWVYSVMRFSQFATQLLWSRQNFFTFYLHFTLPKVAPSLPALRRYRHSFVVSRYAFVYNRIFIIPSDGIRYFHLILTRYYLQHKTPAYAIALHTQTAVSTIDYPQLL